MKAGVPASPKAKPQVGEIEKGGKAGRQGTLA